MRGSALIAIAALFTTPAMAAGVLPFMGAFGNAGGCQLYALGSVPDDDYMLLTPDTFASYGTACDFDALAATEAEVFTVTGICQSEGEAGSGPNSLRVIDHGKDGFGVQFDGLEEWGPFRACPPTRFDADAV